MKTYYWVSRNNQVIGHCQAYTLGHAVEVMARKYGTGGLRSSDCIMESSEYQPQTSLAVECLAVS